MKNIIFIKAILFLTLLPSLSFGQGAYGKVIANRATGGTISIDTVNNNTLLNLKQTTAGQTITIPSLTSGAKTLQIRNIGSVSVTVSPGFNLTSGEFLFLTWVGSSWSVSAGSSSGSDNSKVNVSGDTLTGLLDLGSNDLRHVQNMRLLDGGQVRNTTGNASVELDGSGEVILTASGNISFGAGKNVVLDGDTTKVNGKLIATGTIAGSNFSGSSSGSNTGDQTITLSSDVTGTGTGSIVSTISNDAVTYAKMQNIASGALIGRSTSGSGDPESIAVGSGLSLSGGTLSATGAGSVTNVSSANSDIGVATGTTTPVLTLNSGSGANQIVKRDGDGRIGIDRRDLNNQYTEVGTLFTESWANLSSWTSVGTPSASVSGGQLTLAGTSSLTTNYIRCSGYGNTNIDKGVITWTETVSTIGAATGGKHFSLQSQSVSPHNIGVGVELSTTSTGVIKWYFNNVLYKTTTSIVPGVIAGAVINCKLTILPDKYIFEAGISGSKPIQDILDVPKGPGMVASVIASANAGQFSFINQGGNHTIGAFTATCTQQKNCDILVIGNSIAEGYSCNNFYNRFVTLLAKRYFVTVEGNARNSNRIADFNNAEIALYNPTNILLFDGTNDISSFGAATAFTNLQAQITALGSVTTAAAPSGYSIANGNLKICTELPRASAIYDTYNSSIYSTYSSSAIINLNGICDNSTTTLSQTFDGVHPNDELHSEICEKIAEAYSLKKRETYSNQVVLGADYGNFNTGVGPDAWNINLSTSRFKGEGVFVNQSSQYIPSLTAATVSGMVTPGQFEVYCNNSLTRFTTYTPTLRFRINTSGNISTGAAGSVAYGTTNAGSNGTAHFMIDPQGSLTTPAGGISFSFDNNGIGLNGINGTRRIQFASILPVMTTTTAGSEAGDITFRTMTGGATETEKFRITSVGGFTYNTTNTATGTTGAQTINKPGGTVNFAAGASTLVVTNSLATTSSFITVQVYGTDATATHATVTKASGSFTITLNAAATAETAVGFKVEN